MPAKLNYGILGLAPLLITFIQNIALTSTLDIYFGSRHDAGMKILFLQLR